MALWGVSGSDLKTYGFNTAVGAGVLVGCAVVASAVKKIAQRAFFAMKKPATEEQAQHQRSFARTLGLVAGLGAAVAAAYKFIPASRFALIHDASTSKMFKIGAVQGIVGLCISYPAAAIGSSVSLLTTRYGYHVLAGLGAVGAAIGSGHI